MKHVYGFVMIVILGTAVTFGAFAQTPSPPEPMSDVELEEVQGGLDWGFFQSLIDGAILSGSMGTVTQTITRSQSATVTQSPSGSATVTQTQAP